MVGYCHHIEGKDPTPYYVFQKFWCAKKIYYFNSANVSVGSLFSPCNINSGSHSWIRLIKLLITLFVFVINSLASIINITSCCCWRRSLINIARSLINLARKFTSYFSCCSSYKSLDTSICCITFTCSICG